MQLDVLKLPDGAWTTPKTSLLFLLIRSQRSSRNKSERVVLYAISESAHTVHVAVDVVDVDVQPVK